MTEYFSNLMAGWLKNAPWAADLSPRSPVVYIAAGVFGVLLLAGFVVSMLTIGFTARRHADIARKSQFQQYYSEQTQAARKMVSVLRSAGTKDNEIRKILEDQYHFEALIVNALLANR